MYIYWEADKTRPMNVCLWKHPWRLRAEEERISSKNRYNKRRSWAHTSHRLLFDRAIYASISVNMICNLICDTYIHKYLFFLFSSRLDSQYCFSLDIIQKSLTPFGGHYGNTDFCNFFFIETYYFLNDLGVRSTDILIGLYLLIHLRNLARAH